VLLHAEHGHCGILDKNGKIDNAPSIKRLADIAVSYAQAGAHVIAPSDMMDNRVKAIKEALRAAGWCCECAKTFGLSFAVKVRCTRLLPRCALFRDLLAWRKL